MNAWQTTIERAAGSDVVRRLAGALVHSVWEIAAVAAALWVALLCLRRASAGTRYVACCVALGLTLAAPVLTFWALPHGPPTGASAATAGPSAATLGTPAPAAAPDASSPGNAVAPTPTPASQARAPAPAAAPRPARWAPVAVLFWGAGVTLLSVWNLGGWLAIRRLRREAALPAGAATASLQARVSQLAERIGIRRHVRAAWSALVDAPAVAGWLRPVVLVPVSAMTGLSPAQLDAILAHELAHVRRHDFLVNLLQTVIETLLFYHPATWWVSARARLERELCCDDAAVALCGDRVAYAGALASAERARTPAGAARLAMAATGPGGGALLNRVRRILHAPSSDDLVRPRGAAAAGLGAMLVAGGLLGWFTAAHVPTAPAADRPAGGAQRQEFVGTVTSPEGTGVAGARVSLHAWRGTNARGPVTAGHATTGADGAFRIEPAGAVDLADGRTAVMVEAKGFAIHSTRVAAPPPDAEADGPINVPPVRLSPGSRVRVSFVGPDGRPVAGLKVAPRTILGRGWPNLSGPEVHVPEDAQARLASVSDANGVCTFDGIPRESVLQMRVLDDERFARLTHENRVLVGAEPATTAGPIPLVRAASIDGRLTYAGTGAAARGVDVMAQPIDRGGGSGWGHAVTDDNGHYHLGQLGAGTYNVSVLLDPAAEKEWAAAAIEMLTVAPGERVTDTDLTLVKGGTLEGRVVLKDTGRGVAGVSVGLHGPARPRSSAAIQGVRTAEDGAFSFRVPPGAQYVYVAQAAPEGYLAPDQLGQMVEVADGKVARVTIAFPKDPSPPLAGRVIDADGKPVAGAWVSAEDPKADLSADVRRATTDARGRFSIPAVAPGSLVRARKGDLGTAEPVVVEAGRKSLDVRVVPGAASTSLLLVVADQDGRPVRGARVRVTTLHGRFGTQARDPIRVTDEKGECRIDALAADGRYRFSIDDGDDFVGENDVPVKLVPGKENRATPVLRRTR